MFGCCPTSQELWHNLGDAMSKLDKNASNVSYEDVVMWPSPSLDLKDFRDQFKVRLCNYSSCFRLCHTWTIVYNLKKTRWSIFTNSVFQKQKTSDNYTTPWKFNIAPENIPSQKERFVFQPCIFQGRAVKLREGNPWNDHLFRSVMSRWKTSVMMMLKSSDSPWKSGNEDLFNRDSQCTRKKHQHIWTYVIHIRIKSYVLP